MNIQNQQAAQDLNKGGERQARIEVQRAQKGIAITVWTSKAIEEIIQSWGTGEQQDIKAHGRFWLPARAGQVLRVWQLQQNPGVLPFDAGYFRIDQPGAPLFNDTGGGAPAVRRRLLEEFGPPPADDQRATFNMSALRLCGISEGDGVTFNINGVYELTTIRSIAEQFKLAVKAFYVAFLRPARISVSITTNTQELS